MIDLSTSKPEEVIKPEYLENYQELHKDIFNRLVFIQTSLTIIDTIKKYPLDKLYGSNQGHFWVMIYWNFLYSIIVLLHGLNDEQSGDTLTLQRLKNLIVRDWIQEDKKQSFFKRLGNSKFGQEINAIREKVQGMRHHVVAHRIFDPSKMLPLDMPGVSFLELKKMYKATEKLFKNCSFGTEYLTSLYLPTVEKPEPTAEDVEEIIELLLKNSDWINSPERHGPLWEGIKKQKDQKDIEEMNQWRQKLGMSPA